MPDPVAEFQQVSKRYATDLLGRSGVLAVDNVSFAIQAGEIFGLLGPNRAGKTTLVKILLSLCRPSSGQVLRLGLPVSDPRSLGRIGYMHENQAFPRYLTATGLLEFYGALSFVPPEELRRRIPRLLDRVGLADRCREPIARFSKGMVQRLALAQALINNPDLLVLDEPSEGLDLNGRQLVREIARELRNAGKTVLLVSHVVPEAERLCDRLAVLVAGRIAYLGPVADLLRDPRTGNARPMEQALRELYASSP
ncbi:MAG: ABC transporter ATP-binding protein [Gemmatales bacterium]|nr:ABC transporter ATP-binding protein [Gemmatales bacterium]MDW8385944.1 ABC transporter ATP-binding protein [Gemmatales bacterium]